MSKTRWIESAGGPLVVVPRSASSRWTGASGDDYDEACGVEERLGLLVRPWGHVLVLGDEPLRTTVIQRREGQAIVRWIYAPAEEQLLEVALRADLDTLTPAEVIGLEMRDEPYVIFDSGADGSRAEKLELTPPAGARAIRTYVVKDDAAEVGLVLHVVGP